MGVYAMINFIFLLVSAELGSSQHDCPIQRCTKHGPEIRFPFQLKGRDAKGCGYPGFELSCSQNNETVLEHPFPLKKSINESMLSYSAKFIVKEINYTTQSITISRVDGCLPGLLPQLNLSATPFLLRDEPHYAFPQDYVFLNCSSPSSRYYMDFIPCLSSSGYSVYALNSDFLLLVVPLSCTKMFNIPSIPRSVLGSEIDRIIYLSWSKPTCGRCEMERKHCRLENNGSECFRGDDLKGKVIKGVLIGLATMILASFAFYSIFNFKKKKEDEKRIDQFFEDYKALRPARYTYADLKNITDHFKEKLGQGGYGTVYRGKLPNDVLVAVKVLNNFKGNGEEFVNEVGTIGRIHHVNVVRLVGYCADGYRRGLVYEFLPNESLEKYISSGNQSRSLGWEKLQQIAIGIAKGLDYLHQGCSQRILHFDIKPHNILLDHNFNPKVADFGLAKLCSKEQSKISMTAARGTIGYIAPEVFSRNYGNVSFKADIYSFGMLLLDMVGGRKNFNTRAKDNSEVYFPELMYNQLEKGEEIAIQIDKEEDNKIFKKLTIVGLWCIQWYPVDRPSMKVVIQMLEGDDILIMPPNPFASTKSSAANGNASRSGLYNELETISEGDKVLMLISSIYPKAQDKCALLYSD